MILPAKFAGNSELYRVKYMSYYEVDRQSTRTAIWKNWGAELFKVERLFRACFDVHLGKINLQVQDNQRTLVRL